MMILMKRIIKYSINLACLTLLVFEVALSYALNVRLADIEKVFEIIRNQVGHFALISVVFVIVAAYLNFLFERKVEKRKGSREFLIISLVHFFILILSVAYFSWDFYQDYVAHPEFF